MNVLAGILFVPNQYLDVVFVESGIMVIAPDQDLIIAINVIMIFISNFGLASSGFIRSGLMLSRYGGCDGE